MEIEVSSSKSSNEWWSSTFGKSLACFIGLHCCSTGNSLRTALQQQPWPEKAVKGKESTWGLKDIVACSPFLPTLLTVPHGHLHLSLCNLSLASAVKYFPGDRKDWGGGCGQPGEVVKSRWKKAPRRETRSESAKDVHFSPALNEVMTEAFNPSTPVPDVQDVHNKCSSTCWDVT